MPLLLRKLLHPLTLAVTIEGLLLMVAAWGGHVDPRDNVLPAIFTLSLPIFLAITVLTAVVLLIFRRWGALLLLMLFTAASWPAIHVFAPLNFSSNHTPSEQHGDTLRVLTWNVANFMCLTDADPTATMQCILNSNADVVAIQEGELGHTPFTEMPGVAPLAQQFEQQYPYHSRGYHDLMIFSKRPYTVFRDSTARQQPDPTYNKGSGFHFYAKAFDIEFDRPNRHLRVISVHLQSIGLNPDEVEAYEQMTRLGGRMNGVRRSVADKITGAFRRRADEAHVLRQIIDNSPVNTIVCGDFNDTPASYAYRIVRGDDLRDAFAECHFGPTYTFNQRHLYVNIDHILYRGQLHAVDLKRLKAGCSDHYPLLATFVWTDTP